MNIQNNMEREFEGVWIPKEIWLSSELTALEKIIFVEIKSLDKSDKGCWASNEYLADFCQCSISKITQAVKKLINLKYIEVTNFDGRHRVIRVIKKNRKEDEKQWNRDRF